jgi:hypothetical protein
MVSQQQSTLNNNPQGEKTKFSCHQFIQHKTYESNHFPFFPDVTLAILGAPVVTLPAAFFLVDFVLATPWQEQCKVS